MVALDIIIIVIFIGSYYNSDTNTNSDSDINSSNDIYKYTYSISTLGCVRNDMLCVSLADAHAALATAKRVEAEASADWIMSRQRRVLIGS